MERIFVTNAFDGKIFEGTNPKALEEEVNAYEIDLKLKLAKEESDKKAKEEQKTELVNKIKQRSKELDLLFTEYEKLTGKHYVYYSADYNDVNLPRLINGFINGWWF